MNTSLYYADEFAISTLEQVLNIKIIVISHDQYEEDNKKTFEKSNKEIGLFSSSIFVTIVSSPK